MAGNTIGIDVGGTKILAVLVDDSGAIAARAKTASPTDSSEALMEAVKATVRQVTAKAHIELSQISAIGAGVPGVVDADGRCIWAPNCPLTDVQVARILAEEFAVPVAVGNDVNVGTLGEKAFGAGREFDDVFGMFVGTGIGGGLIVNGRIVIGEHCLGAEVGHIIIDHEAALRGDEGGGEYEYVAGRLGIERAIKQAIADGRECSIAAKLGKGANDRIKSGLLKQGLDDGDAVVTEVLSRTADIIGLATVTVIHLVDPQAIIFGGGVIEACSAFMVPRIEASIQAHVAPGNGRPIRILLSELGDDAVALGAAALGEAALSEPDLGAARAPGTARPSAGAVARAPIAKDAEYPALAATEFGTVVVGGQLRHTDLVIRADGSVKKRKKRLSREVHGTAHEVSLDEVVYVCKGGAETLVMGTGYEGLVSLGRDAERWLEEKGITAVVLPTPQAAAAYNQATGRKAVLLHVGC